jgi:hypothetical protein
MVQPVGQWPPLDAAHVPLVHVHDFFPQHADTVFPFDAQHVFGGQHCALEPVPQSFDPAAAVLAHLAALRG